MSRNLFITGTGTDVGKTYVAGLLVKKLYTAGRRAAYFKAAMSGNSRCADGSLVPGDALWVKEFSGISQSLESMCPYVYESAVSPHLAAKLEGNPIEFPKVLEQFDRICNSHEFVTIEGSGGICCPLRWDGQRIGLSDLIRARGLKSLLVAEAGLGTINAVVLSVEYMRAHKLPIRGILFNRYEQGNRLHEDNKRMCEEMTGLKIVACIGEGSTELCISNDYLESLYG